MSKVTTKRYLFVVIENTQQYVMLNHKIPNFGSTTLHNKFQIIVVDSTSEVLRGTAFIAILQDMIF